MLNRLSILGWAASLAFVVTGCNQETPTEPVSMNDMPPDTIEAGGGHAHASHGPHNGDLIELGNEEYHAELVHEAGSVTIYVLDSSAKKAVPIAAQNVMINLKHDGKPEQVTLAAAPQEGDGEGKSSRFASNNADLASHLDAEAADARLMLEIDGKSYNGAIAHDHAGHSH